MMTNDSGKLMSYPIRFKEILRDYGFGNRRIVELFQKTGLPENHRIAETWEICDRPGESSQVTNGPYKNFTLHDLIELDAINLLGTEVTKVSGKRFPLLIKILDASFTLGEQAHHTDGLAARRGLSDPGKTEAWVMLKTEPGAEIRCGQINDQVTKENLGKAILEGRAREFMRPYQVQAGDAFLLYSGTMHYSPGGVIFYEIMQNSDVYISLRKPPDTLSSEERLIRLAETLEGVHLEAGYDCQTNPIELMESENIRSFLLACDHFALEKITLNKPYMIHCDGRHFKVITLVSGSCQVGIGGYTEILLPGQSCFIPANSSDVLIEPNSKASFLVGYVPDLTLDIINPLRTAGFSDDRITRLGGMTRLNSLRRLIFHS